MAIKLHRCSFLWLRLEGHPCHRVQKALDEQGIEYEIVKEPALRGKRDRIVEKTGQKLIPVIEFEDGSTYRADSKDIAERIRAGELQPEESAPPA